MKAKSIISMRVNVRFRLYNPDGSLKTEWGVKNQVTNVGASWGANRSHAATLPVMSQIAIGSASGGKGVGSVALQAQTAIVAFSGVVTVAKIVTYSAIFGPGVGTGNCEEAGIFTPLLAWVDYPAFNKIAGETLAIDWEVHYNNP